MPTTRKKVIKTVYKNEDGSEVEDGDFSDSGSEAVISQRSSSDDEEEPYNHVSSEEEQVKKKNKIQKPKTKRKRFTKSFMEKLTKQNTSSTKDDVDSKPESKPSFSIKDLTEADKLLPAFLNLSESDSSDDDDEHKVQSKPVIYTPAKPDKFETDTSEKVVEYQDVWSNNLKESEEIAQRAFMELEQHKTKLEETKKSIQKYKVQNEITHESDIKDLLALGEDVIPSVVTPPKSKKGKNIKSRNYSDSEIEDWEEVADAKTIPQQGLQLIVDIPGAVCRKTKKLDVEMMMKRKINRVKKEYQVYMHKVHVLCWLGHGNFVSQVLNDQDVLSASLSLIPSKECYPGERVDMKYVEQITNWFKDKLKIKFDKNEGKFRPKAPPLKNLILQQIKRRSVTSKKYVVFIFVSMLRALGLQCRIILNFTTLPIKPPVTELCSLSTKAKTDVTGNEKEVKSKGSKKESSKKLTNKKTGDCIPQLDGNYDYLSDSDYDSIIQLDGNDDTSPKRRRAAVKRNKKSDQNSNDMCDDVSPPKIFKRNLKVKKLQTAKNNPHVGGTSSDNGVRKRPNSPVLNVQAIYNTIEGKSTEGVSPPKRSRRNLSVKKAVDSGNIIKDGSNSQNQILPVKVASKTDHNNSENQNLPEEVSLPIRRRRNLSVKKVESNTNKLEDSVNKNKAPTIEKKDIDHNEERSVVKKVTRKSLSLNKKQSSAKQNFDTIESKALSPPTTNYSDNVKNPETKLINVNPLEKNIPAIVISDANALCQKIKDGKHSESKRDIRARKRSHTCDPEEKQKAIAKITKPRANSASSGTVGSSQKNSSKSKYFNESEKDEKFDFDKKLRSSRKIEKKDTMRKNNDLTDMIEDESKRVSHRDLANKTELKIKNDVTHDLVSIIKKRVQEAKDSRKVKTNTPSDEDSDYLPEITEQQKASTSKNGNAKAGTARKIDRRVVSTDDESPKNKMDVWCEVYVEELEQWIAVDVIKGRVHCVNEIYSGTTHPVNYVVGWDNNNYLKDLTRRYVPHWNTVTRKQRVDPAWWDKAVRPWLGPKTARDREEDEGLDRMQLDAPLPKSIAEYKNHPLYALKRHLLKFEAIYPPDAATLGFVRGEAVYARECVYVCRSRDTWLKEAKVVRLGEEPYKVVKARPKWDRLSNKLITDKPLEVFGPWQVQEYEPPVAENGIVPRNAYGNVELFKECMLPKGTVHIKLPGLNRVAKKLNIDCAPAMTGFDFNGGWSHPVYDGFVVCQEFEDIITNAWHEDQLEQERKELEKLEARVYGHWRRLIKGLLIRERLKLKYGFSEPSTSQNTKKTSVNPKLTVKKNCLNSKRK